MTTLHRQLRSVCLGFVAFAVLGLSASPVHATSYYLQIADIAGESKERYHEEWIDIYSFNWGLTAGGRGGAVPSPFTWTQGLDASVPALFQAVASGKSFPDVTFEAARNFTDGGNIVFFEMEFENVMLTSLNLSGNAANAGLAIASGALTYQTLTMTYTLIDDRGRPSGEFVGGWDFADGEAAFFGSPQVLEGFVLAGPTAVPVPAAIWLLGSGLIGLLGFGRRRSLLSQKA